MNGNLVNMQILEIHKNNEVIREIELEFILTDIGRDATIDDIRMYMNDWDDMPSRVFRSIFKMTLWLIEWYHSGCEYHIIWRDR